MASSISLPYYPDSNRLPGFFADVDGSRANTALVQQRAVLIAYMQAVGTAVAGTGFLATSLTQVASSCGIGSMAYAMYAAYRAQDTFGEVWILPIAEPSGGTAWSGSVTFGAAATAQGTLSEYIAGSLVAVPVLAGDTGAVVAARFAALVAVMPTLPVTASVNAGVVTLTATHKGTHGNDIALSQNYLGAAGGEAPVPGLTVALAGVAAGSGVPANLAAALASLGDMTADFICCPFADAVSLNALDAFLNETGTGRWSWNQMLYGGYFTAYRGTAGSLAAFGNSRNGKFGSCIEVLTSEPEPVWVHAADYCGACAASLRNDPGMPLQYIQLNTKPALPADRLTGSLRNTLLYDGISTKKVTPAGQNQLERAVTFYQINPAGTPDNSWLDVETPYSTAALLRRWQIAMASQFARRKLVADGTVVPRGSNLVTPMIITVATIAWYRSECEAGNAQQPDVFAKAVLSQNAGNGEVKELLPLILVNQLRQIAAVAQFTKP